MKASLDAPAQVEAGVAFEVKWTGPNNPLDYVGIGSSDRPYIVYAYTKAGNPTKLTAPDEPGTYELRYFLGQGDTVIGTRSIAVGGVSATVAAQALVKAGATFAVTWTGPGNELDFITLVPAGAPPKEYAGYAYTSKGSPLELTAPDRPGQYEVRYLTGQSYATLASAKVEVTPISGSLQGPAEAPAGSTFAVRWEGPGNQHDYITVVAKGAREGESGNYAYTASGNPVSLLAPLDAGDYELRYATGQSHTTLARSSIRVTAGKESPGFVTVTVASAVAGGNAIEIILDASGSMLQRIGSERRIDIAKKTLTSWSSTDIPAGTPFAFRVFGREVDSCQTDLDIALGPLDRAAVAGRIGKLEAKNNAKTPIGASLEKVADDLAPCAASASSSSSPTARRPAAATRRRRSRAREVGCRAAREHRRLRHRRCPVGGHLPSLGRHRRRALLRRRRCRRPRQGADAGHATGGRAGRRQGQGGGPGPGGRRSAHRHAGGLHSASQGPVRPVAAGDHQVEGNHRGEVVIAMRNSNSPSSSTVSRLALPLAAVSAPCSRPASSRNRPPPRLPPPPPIAAGSSPACRRRPKSEGLAEPFKGVTTDGELVPGLFSVRSTGVSTEPVRKAAEGFLAVVDRRSSAPTTCSRWTTRSGASG